MGLTFRQWLEAGNVVEIPPEEPGELPYPTPYRYPRDKKATGPGREPDAGKTNAMGDFHMPGSDELPPTPANKFRMKKMKARATKK